MALSDLVRNLNILCFSILPYGHRPAFETYDWWLSSRVRLRPRVTASIRVRFRVDLLSYPVISGGLYDGIRLGLGLGFGGRDLHVRVSDRFQA